MPATAHQQLAASAMHELTRVAAETGRLNRAAAQRAFDDLMAAFPAPPLRLVQVGDHDAEQVADAEYDLELEAFAHIMGARP